MSKPLSPMIVMELRRRAIEEPNFSPRAEARRLGLNVETIRRLLRGETHNHQVDVEGVAAKLFGKPDEQKTL